METDQEIINLRESIWEALSEFYVDTELSTDDLKRIKGVFTNSELTLEEIRDIDLYEVFPLLQANLLAPAGVWTGFDQSWLNEKCLRRYRRRNNFLHQLNCKFWNIFFYDMRKGYWKAIENMT